MRDTRDSLCRQNSVVAFLRVALFFGGREATTGNTSALHRLFYARGGGRKGVEMLVVSLRDVNFGFWSHLGCSGHIFNREGLV